MSKVYTERSVHWFGSLSALQIPFWINANYDGHTHMHAATTRTVYQSLDTECFSYHHRPSVCPIEPKEDNKDQMVSSVYNYNTHTYCEKCIFFWKEVISKKLFYFLIWQGFFDECLVWVCFDPTPDKQYANDAS